MIREGNNEANERSEALFVYNRPSLGVTDPFEEKGNKDSTSMSQIKWPLRGGAVQEIPKGKEEDSCPVYLADSCND